jgi:uncharacterized RDD family membrane protein YckC
MSENSGNLILFGCQCGKKYKAKASLSGKTTECKRCGKPLVIPTASTEDQSAASTSAPPMEDSRIEGQNGKTLSQAAAAGTSCLCKKCNVPLTEAAWCPECKGFLLLPIGGHCPEHHVILEPKPRNAIPPTYCPQCGREYSTGAWNDPVFTGVRPWVRFWARQTDYIILFFPLVLITFFIFILIALMMPSGIRSEFFSGLRPGGSMAYNFFSLIVVFALWSLLYYFTEAILLSSWGTTPGKWLLHVKVRRGDGEKLTFKDALNRAFRVLAIGEGFGLPLVNLATRIRAYHILRIEGRTSWDQSGGHVVFHAQIGTLRVIVVALIWLLWFLGFALLARYGNG